jgi:hypothetical protein
MNELDSSYWSSFLTVFDYVLLPFYLAIVYFIAYKVRDSRYGPGHPWRKYFIPGLTVKVLGAIFIGLIYEYYYHGGDTSAYFYHAKVINQSLEDSPVKWMSLLLHLPDGYDYNYYKYISQMMWYKNQSAYMVSSLTAFLSTFTFNTFLPTSVLFAALSFTGVWAMFRTFAEQYPKLIRPLAIAVLFIPSTFVWGSGIFKDTVCIAALGWMTFISFRMLVNRRFTTKNLVIFAICFYVLIVIKIYIALVFIPALALWILNTYSQRIGNSLIRGATKLAVYASIIVAFIGVTSVFASELGQYSLDRLAQTSNTTRTYIHWASTQGGDEGSAYDLGEFDPSIGGMLTKFPLAVNVALFRPYIWESRKPIILLNALEAFLFLFFTLKVLFGVGLKRTWGAIASDPNIQFFLLFTLIFAFAVGISSYNFGALSRYRIPCLPFYALALILIYYKYNPPEKNFFTARFS